VEKLNSIARSTGLKFTAVSSGTDCYISTESFYVEIKMETSGKIKEVNVSHGNESKVSSCQRKDSLWITGSHPFCLILTLHTIQFMK
jgi:hypothetical protein